MSTKDARNSPCNSLSVKIKLKTNLLNYNSDFAGRRQESKTAFSTKKIANGELQSTIISDATLKRWLQG